MRAIFLIFGLLIAYTFFYTGLSKTWTGFMAQDIAAA